MKKIFMTMLVFGLVIAGCSGGQNGTNESVNNAPTTAPSRALSNEFGELEMGLAGLESYQARFTLSFEGETNWEYSVVTRFDGEAIEYTQQIVGVSGAANPGDIRLVHARGISQMVGEGTDGFCMQFPDSFDAGVDFLMPTDLINTAFFDSEPKAGKADEIAGLSAVPYELNGENVTDWQEAALTFWLNEESNAVMQYDLTLIGDDPLFNAGAGTLTGAFIIESVDPQEIAPITECTITLPMAEDAAEIIQLPGLIVYETTVSVEDLAAYYHDVLIAEKWERRALPQTAPDGATLLAYVTDLQQLDINIEPYGEGAKVELYYADR